MMQATKLCLVLILLLVCLCNVHVERSPAWLGGERWLAVAPDCRLAQLCIDQAARSCSAAAAAAHILHSGIQWWQQGRSGETAGRILQEVTTLQPAIDHLQS